EARSGGDRVVSEKLVAVRIEVALFHVFVGEVRSEEARRFFLRGHAAVPVDRRSVEPLLRGPAGVRERQEPDALDLGGLLELDQALGLRPPTEPPRAPGLLLGLSLLF